MKAVIDICQHSALAGGGKTYANGLVRLNQHSLSVGLDDSFTFMMDESQSMLYEDLPSEHKIIFDHPSLHPNGKLGLISRLHFDTKLSSKAKEYIELLQSYEVVHMTGDRASPFIKNKPLVITAFGGNHWIRPRSLTVQNYLRKYMSRSVMGHSLKSADAIIVPSVFMKDILVQMIGIPSKKIFVNELVWWASDIVDIKESAPNSAIDNQIDKPFLLYSAAGYDYKNHVFVFEAIKTLARKHGTRVSVGLTGKLSPHLKALISQYKNEVDILEFGYVSKEELKWLYMNACAYIHPSLYEAGGSFSMYEAAYCECPVLCSRVGSMLELGNSFARTFDPYTPDTLSQVLSELLQNKDNLIEMKESGVRFTKQYSAEKAKNEIEDAYKFAINNWAEK